jgi:hypothetical protein
MIIMSFNPYKAKPYIQAVLVGMLFRLFHYCHPLQLVAAVEEAEKQLQYRDAFQKL